MRHIKILSGQIDTNVTWQQLRFVSDANYPNTLSPHDFSETQESIESSLNVIAITILNRYIEKPRGIKIKLIDDGKNLGEQ